MPFLLTDLDVHLNAQQEKFNKIQVSLVTFRARKLIKAITKQVKASNFEREKMFSSCP